MTTIVAALVAAEDARQRCIARGQAQWADRWGQRTAQLMALAPSGARFDNGTTLDINSIRGCHKVVFHTAFHHMRDDMYTRWTEHKVIVTASFTGIDVRVTGRDYNGIKDYIGETFEAWLTSEAPPVPW